MAIKPLQRNPKLKATSFIHSNQQGKLYINSGLLKGRKLQVVLHDDLRPTLLANRQLLINWLRSYHYSSILDLFAGSGSLSLEVLSNEAINVTAVELESKIFTALEKNFTAVQIDLRQAGKRYNLIKGEALQILHKLSTNQLDQQFDLLLLDPPFALSVEAKWVEELLLNCTISPAVVDKALIFLELDISFRWDDFLLQLQQKLIIYHRQLRQLKYKQTGKVIVLLLQVQSLI